MRGFGIGRDLLDLLGQHQRAEPARAARAQRSGAGVEGHRIAVLDLAGKTRFDLGQRNRRRQHDAARRRGAGQFGDGEERLARQRRGRIDIAAAAVGEQEGATAAAAVLGDAVGISEREQRRRQRFVVRRSEDGPGSKPAPVDSGSRLRRAR